MLARIARASLTAVRHFSAKAAAEATVKPATTVGSSTSNEGDTLGRRLLTLVYSRKSAVIVINKWKEEGHKVQKYQLNRIVRELRRLKRYKHALEICEWMRLQKDIKLQSGDYAVQLDLISKIRGLNSAEKFFLDLPENMRDYNTCSALMHTYSQHNEPDKAEALMAKMSECGLLKHALPYNHLLTLYISRGQLEKVPELISELKKNTTPDIVTYNLWLSYCASHNDIEAAEEVFSEMGKKNVYPDWLTYSTLTSLYIKKSLKKKAAFTLAEMEKRVTKKVRVAYSSLISLHTSLDHKDEVYWVWKKMKSTYHKLNDSEYLCMIASILKLNETTEAEKLYKEWASVSPTNDVRIPNLLVAAYVNRNQIEKAEKMLNVMVEKGSTPSYMTWLFLTQGYLKNENRSEKALDSFKKMLASMKKKWDPDEKLIKQVFSILEEQGNVDGAESMLVALRCAGHVSASIYNSLLRTYAAAGKMPLIVAERMKKDNVPLDEETNRLIRVTSKMCVTEIPPSSIC